MRSARAVSLIWCPSDTLSFAIVEQDVHVDERLRSHLARAQHVEIAHPVDIHQHRADRLDLLGIEPGVDELLHALAGDAVAHPADHPGDDHRRDRIQVAEPEQGAADADDDHDRRRGVAARVPRVRFEELRAKALRGAHGVVVDALLEPHRDRRDGHRPPRRNLKLLGMEQPSERIERDPGADDDQHHAERHGRGGLDALVAVGVLGVRLGARELRREQNQKVGDEIGERMHAVGDQRLRVRGEASCDLRERQDQIDPGTDQGDAADDGVALGCRVAHLRDEHPPGARRFSRLGHRCRLLPPGS